MRSTLRLQGTKLYWLVRRGLMQVGFSLRRFTFHRRRGLEKATQGASIGFELLSGIASSLFVSFFLVLFVEMLGWLVMHYVPVVGQWMSAYYVQPGGNQWPYDTLLSSIASVTGVFLALYYTVITGVAGQVFAKYPNDLLPVLLRERISDHYLRSLSLLTAVSLVYLGYRALHGQPGPLGVIFIVGFGCYGVFCFAQLGLRAFYFFDPANISFPLLSDLRDSVALSTVDGYAWNDASFQAHYHKQAANTLRALKVLIGICATEPHLKESMQPVLHRLLRFMTYYLRVKGRIPSDSRWFKRKAKYPNWFLTSSPTISAALETGTGLQPQVEPHHYWLEDETIQFVLEGMRKSLGRGDLVTVYSLLDPIAEFLQECGRQLETSVGSNLIREVGEIVDQISLPGPNGDRELDDVSLDVVVEYASLPIAMLLGFFKEYGLENARIAFSSRVGTFDSGWAAGPYRTRFPARMVNTLEDLRDKLTFEVRVEHAEVTTLWLQNQLLAGRFGELLLESAEAIVAEGEGFYPRISSALHSSKLYSVAAMVAQVGIEWCDKAEAHLAACPDLSRNLDVYRIRPEMQWPVWNWSSLLSRVKAVKESLLAQLADCLPHLTGATQDGKRPDTLGHAYHLVCMHLHRAVAEGDVDSAQRLCKPFFIGGVISQELLRDETKDWHDKTSSVLLLTTPLADAMALSGYAAIYAELYERPELWEAFRQMWDTVIRSYPNPEKGFETLTAVHHVHSSALLMTPHSFLFTEWKQQLDHTLRRMGLLTERYGMSGLDATPNHPSALIRALCTSDYGVLDEPSDIFLVKYLEDEHVELDPVIDRFGLRQRIREEQRERNECSTDDMMPDQWDGPYVQPEPNVRGNGEPSEQAEAGDSSALDSGHQPRADTDEEELPDE